MSRDSRFAAALNAALAERDMTSTELRRRLARTGLQVSAAALSYWRSGQRRPEGQSIHVIEEIEWILDLPAGSLASSVGPSRRMGAARTRSFDDLTERPGQLGSLTSLAMPSGLEVLAQWTVIDIGPDGYTCRLHERRLWRARTDGAQVGRVFLHMERSPAAAPDVLAFGGCRIGAVEFDPTTGFVGAELVLSRQLDAGESVMTEHAFDGPIDTVPIDNYHSVAESRLSQGCLWVRFAPTTPPRDVVSFETVDERHTERPVRVVGNETHHVVHSFGPAVYGLTWTPTSDQSSH